MEAVVMSIARLSLAIATSFAITQPMEWCDSCGEMYTDSELTQEMDYGLDYHGRICEGCETYWQDYEAEHTEVATPVDWCDSCGEMYEISELTQEVDYGKNYHGRICEICAEFWQL